MEDVHPVMTHGTESGQVLRRDSPAVRWLEALPLGNGRLGAMVWGDPHRPRFSLNDSTLWSGYPGVTDGLRTSAEDASRARSAAREQFRQGEPIRAQAEIERLGAAWSQGYQPVGDLFVTCGDAAEQPVPEAGYERRLDLVTGVHTVRTAAGDHVTFTSGPDDVLVHAFPCGSEGAIELGFTTALAEEWRDVFATAEADGDVPGGGLDIVVRAPSNLPPGRHRDVADIAWDPEHASHAAVSVRWRRDPERARVLVVCSIATTWQGLGRAPDRPVPETLASAQRTARAALARGEDSLLARHLASPLPGADAVSLELRGSAASQRLATMFAYGRYLLAAASSPDRPPANLQGIWNAQVGAPWSSNFTVNINLEMNHWCAGVAQIPDAARALEGYVAMLRTRGRDTAARLYRARGWTVHHNSDPWGYCDPVRGNGKWSSWPMGGLWLERELDSIAAFSGRTAQEIAQARFAPQREIAAFALDLLTEDDEGALVTFPSTSPENEWIHAAGTPVPERREAAPDHVGVALTEGSGMDRWLVRETLSHLIATAKILGREDDPVVAEAIEALPRIAGPRIGADGRILEWHADGLAEIEPHHRHVSHLAFVYPGTEPVDQPTERAVIRTLEARGDEATGWSLAWKTCLWARLRRGERVQALLELFLRDAEVRGPDGALHERSGLYPNLFSAHPPFQMDGNLGIVAGISEALLQSHRGEIELLPALPPIMRSGSVRGLHARPGVEVAMAWTDGVLTSLELRAAGPGAVGAHRVRLGDRAIDVRLKNAEPVTVDVARLNPTTHA